jgi:peptide/nickel transport system permease protein
MSADGTVSRDQAEAAPGAAVPAGPCSSEPKLPAKRPALWREVARRRTAAAGFLTLATIVLLAVLAPVLPIVDPNAIHAADRLAAAGTKGYVLGADELGRDLLSRIIWGGQISLMAGVVATTLAMLLGTPLGLTAASYGGRMDDILMRLTDVVLAFPLVLLAIGIVAALGPGLLNTMVAVALAGFPLYARVVRGSALSAREMDYILAPKAVGASNLRIMIRHLLPNIFAPLLVTFTLDVGQKIVITSSLSFLGLGAQPPTADWGSMIATGRNYIRNASHLIFVPGAAIFAVVLSLNLVGDALRDTLDPRMQRR